MSATLYLPVKGMYFDQIKAGTKPDEFRLCTPYWKKRLEGRHYDRVELTRGYPKRDDAERRLNLPYRGYVQTTITHEFFGSDPASVYAINVDVNTCGLDIRKEQTK